MTGLRFVHTTLPDRDAAGGGIDASAETAGPLRIACPSCGLGYVADRDAAEPWDLEALEWEAVSRLAGECPDHPHRFAVGP